MKSDISRLDPLIPRLVLRHKPKKVSVIAAMRKLLLIANAVYKNKTVYVPG